MPGMARIGLIAAAVGGAEPASVAQDSDGYAGLDLQRAQEARQRTLERDDAKGTIIYPKHVHKALRRYLGIENTPGARRFPFGNTEDFAFFG